MNAAVQAGPANSVKLSVNPTQAAPDTPGGAAEATVSDGAFKEVLEKRMQSGTTTPADKPAPEGATVVALEVSQLVDSNRSAADAMVALLALQPAPAAAAGATASATAADPLLQTIARGSVAEWTPAKGLDIVTVDTGDTGASGRRPGPDAEGPLEPELRAAIGAAAGKPLPPTASDPGASFRAQVQEAGLAGRAVDRDLSQPVAMDALPPAPGPLQAAGTGVGAPGTTQPAEVRVASTQVAVPFGRPEWTSAMNERVTWLVGQRMQSADIQLNPPQLGPVEVRITIQNDQASLFFTSHNGAVREAIQAALPRLNEMLAQGGLSLGQTSVGAESFAGQQQAFRDGHGRRQGVEEASTLAGAAVAGAAAQGAVTMTRGRVGIDMFV